LCEFLGKREREREREREGEIRTVRPHEHPLERRSDEKSEHELSRGAG